MGLLVQGRAVASCQVKNGDSISHHLAQQFVRGLLLNDGQSEYGKNHNKELDDKHDRNNDGIFHPWHIRGQKSNPDMKT